MITIQEAPGEYSFSKNKMDFRLCTDSEGTDRKICVQILMDDGTNQGNPLTPILDQVFKVDEDGCIQFDPSYLFDRCINFDCPPFGTDLVMLNTNTRQYEIIVSEKYINENGEKQETDPDNVFSGCVTKGGVEKKSYSKNFIENRLKADFTKNTELPVLPQFAFLQNYKNGKPVKITCVQPQYLSFFLCAKAGDEFWLEFTFKLNDGSTALNLSYDERVKLETDYKGYLTFPVGLCQIEKFLNTGVNENTIQEYTVLLNGSPVGDNFSQPVTFCLTEHTSCTRYFKYTNAYGGTETIHTKGERSTSVQISGIDILDNDGNTGTFKKKKREAVSQTSGYIYNRCTIRNILQFLMSEDTQEIDYCQEPCDCSCPDPKTGVYCSIKIRSGSYPLGTDSSRLINFNIPFEYSNEEVVCSPTICPCKDKPGVTFAVTEEILDYCPVSLNAMSRMYVRRSGNNWFFYGWLNQLVNQLNAAGATGMVINHEFHDTATGTNTGITYLGAAGNPSSLNYVYGRMDVNNIQSITYSGTIQFQLNGHTICYTLPPQTVQAPGFNTGWVFSFANWDCEDKDAETLVCLSVEANDDITDGYDALTETTEGSLDGGITFFPISLPIDEICFNPNDLSGDIIIRRCITTSNPDCVEPVCCDVVVWEKPKLVCTEITPQFEMDEDGCISLVNADDFMGVCAENEAGDLIDGIVKLCPFSSVDNLGVYDTGAAAYHSFVDDGYMYISNTTNGLTILNVSDPNNITLASNLPLSPNPNPVSTSGVQIIGNIAYIVDTSNGVYSVDISDPLNPVILDFFAGGSRDLIINGNTLYIMSNNSGLTAIDISNPSNMTQLWTSTSVTNFESFKIFGNYLYAGAISGIHIYDLSNQSYLTQITTTNYVGSFCCIGDVLYAQSLINYISAYDLSNPAQPVHIANITIPQARQVVCLDDCILIPSESNGITVVDVSDPNNMSIIENIPTTINSQDLQVAGDLLHLTSINGEVEILRYVKRKHAKLHVKCPNETGEITTTIFQLERIDNETFNVLDSNGNQLISYRNNAIVQGTGPGAVVVCCGDEFIPDNPNEN